MSKTTLLISLRTAGFLELGKILKKDVKELPDSTMKQKLLNIFVYGACNTNAEIENEFENYKEEPVNFEGNFEDFKQLLKNEKHSENIEYEYGLLSINGNGDDILLMPEENIILVSIMKKFPGVSKEENDEDTLCYAFEDYKEKGTQLKVYFC